MGDVYSMGWVMMGQWVMVGIMKGHVGWKVVAEQVKEDKFPRHKPSMVEFSLPGAFTTTPYVDRWLAGDCQVCGAGQPKH